MPPPWHCEQDPYATAPAETPPGSGEGFKRDNPPITSKNAAQEVDFYSVWSATEWLTVTGVIAFAVPGAGLKQAAQAFVIDNGPVGRGVGRTMTLAELFVSIKY